MSYSKVSELNRLILLKGGKEQGGTVLECVKILAKELEGIDIPSNVVKVAEAIKYVNDVLSGTCEIDVVVVNADTEEELEGAELVIRTGSTVGIGDEVKSLGDKYELHEGDYNYSVTKDGFVKKAGAFAISEAHVLTGKLTLEISLKPLSK